MALPTWACYDVLTAAIGAGAPLLFYDLDPDTLAPDVATLTRLASLTPAAVILVHAFGVPVDLASARRTLPPQTVLIEDSAQAWGTTHGRVAAGSAGDSTVLSFGRGKGITGGSGGALLRRAAGAARGPDGVNASGLRDVAVALALWILARPALYGIPASLPWLRLGETQYKPPCEVQPISRAAAAIVLASLAAADQAARERRLHADAFRSVVEASDRFRNIRIAEGAKPGWLRLPVLARDAATRDELLVAGRSLGVAAGYPRPLTALARELGTVVDTVSGDAGARELAARLFTLPTHTLLRERDIAAVRALIRGR